MRVLLFVAMALAGAPAPEEVGARLTDWSPGRLDIHHISTGRGNASLVIFPDGTSLLVDAGDSPNEIPYATARPNDSRSPGEWIARYVRHMLPGRDPAIDYALLTHFHTDHMGHAAESDPLSGSGAYRLSGITEVGEHLSIRKMLDRAWPDYDYPFALEAEYVKNYRSFLDWQLREAGMEIERFQAGRNDQIVLRRAPGRYPSFEVRNLTSNGEVWTGVRNNTRNQFPPLDTLPPENLPSENMCSNSFRLSYGKFDYYAGGDLTGIPRIGHPSWQNMETAVAKALGPVDVHVVNHHGSIDPASPFFLSTLRPRVHIVPSWAPTHPAPSVLKRLLSERAYPGPRDIFLVQFREPTKAAIGPRAEKVQSDGGHIVIRVEPGGGRYRVLLLDDSAETYEVTAVHGPYDSQ
jgi:glyoxylase-like metal-dependent hydrolase (beta-lactamase superfamily II)